MGVDPTCSLTCSYLWERLKLPLSLSYIYVLYVLYGLYIYIIIDNIGGYIGLGKS